MFSSELALKVNPEKMSHYIIAKPCLHIKCSLYVYETWAQMFWSFLQKPNILSKERDVPPLKIV